MIRGNNLDGLQSGIRLPEPFLIPFRSPLLQAWRLKI